MIRRMKLWLLDWREDWISGQLEVVEQQIQDAPVRRRLLLENLRRVRTQQAQLHTGRELLSQALARREAELAIPGAQSGGHVASRRQIDYGTK